MGLSQGKRARFPREGKQLQDTYQPMPKVHGHLMCHWLLIYLPLSDLITPPKSPIPLVNFIIITWSSSRDRFFCNNFNKVQICEGNTHIKTPINQSSKWFTYTKILECDKIL